MIGILRDQDGAVVAGARVEALDAAGAVLARDRSAADGTFALAVPARPAALRVLADDADPLRLSVPPAGTAAAGIVRRHRAADLIPSVADVAALPAGLLADVASVIPYRVAFPGDISDRWLARGRDVTTVEGLPFYRRGDGADTTPLLPAHAFGSVSVRDGLAAPFYGDRAVGGVVDAQLFDRQDLARAAGRDASFAFGRNPALLVASSWDADGARRVAAARGSGTLGPVSANLVALLGTAPGATYAGAGADLRASTRVLDLGLRLDVTRDDNLIAPAPDTGRVASIVLDGSARGPAAIAVRARWRDEHGELGGLDASHHDAALVFATTRGNVARIGASLALTYGDQGGYEAKPRSALAVLPTLSFDAPVNGTLSVHAGYGRSTLGTPGSPLARATLGEVALAYSDRRRLRADVVAYAEGDDAPPAVTRGLGASLGWEIAPRVSLRVWSLRDGDVIVALRPASYPAPAGTIAVRTNFQRDVVWLTWDAPTRFDLLVRNGVLEGGLRIPLGARYALDAGSYRRPNATRVLSVGLTAR